MKRLIRAFPITSLLAVATALGSPLQQEQVSADAKWLLHLDLDKLRATRVGAYFSAEVLQPKLSKPKADLKRDLNFDLDVNRISSITAYGTDYQKNPDANGVLLIATDLAVEKALEGAIQKFSSESGNGSGPIKKLQAGPNPIYSINDDAFVSVHPGKLVVLGKNRAVVERAEAVLNRKAGNLTAGKVFSGFPDVPKAFFFVAIAEGFNEDAPLPPQAKVLKLTDGARLVLGENAANLFLNLSLKAKSPEVVAQMAQVIQGTIALASLSQSENPDLLQLTQSIKVSSEDKMITIGVEYPVEKAVKKLGEQKSKRKGE